MHLNNITIDQSRYPTYDYYPFNLPVFQKTKRITFNAPVTFFAGENGSGKSTLLQALSRSCGIHIWQEAETALSPRSQLALLELLTETSAKDHAQFIIATHSPILLACPRALIYSFDYSTVRQILYEETEHYKIYRDFLENRLNYLKQPA
jgi:predicted ATPase